MKKIIWIDLDEVLAELLDHALDYHNYEISWHKITRESIEDYYFRHMINYDISLEEGINWFRKVLFDDDKLEVKTVEWALQWLKKLKNKWYKLKIITARRYEFHSEYTKKWIEKHYPNIFDEIIFNNHFDKSKQKAKSEFCKEHGIFHMVEDNPDYALELAENWIITYLLEKPWNRKCIKHENIICVKNWSEIDL